MLSVEEARERVLRRLGPLPEELVPLADAPGRVCARPLPSRLDNPPADISAMDGYAVRAADTAPAPGGEDAMLRLVGESAAGHPFSGRVGPGECVRLFTGSVMPAGSDCVLIQENAERNGDRVRVSLPVASGRNVRARGRDFQAGDVVVPAGRRIGVRDLAVAAAAGQCWIAVHRRPRIAVLSTGDELAMPGEPIPPGGVVNCNTPMLGAFLRAVGAEPVLLPPARDDLRAIADAAGALGGGVDMLVTLGGASVGDYDLVRDALVSRGFALDFWRIAMRPGKPLMHGSLPGEGGRALPMLGLPGNPVSALVCALLFLWPAVRRLGGERFDPGALDTEPAILGAPLRQNDARADFLRAGLHRDALGRRVATPFALQDSGMIGLLAGSDALILRDPFAPAAEAGETVQVLPLARYGL